MTDPVTFDVGRLADEIRKADAFEALEKSRELANATDELRAKKADEGRSATTSPPDLFLQNMPMIDRLVGSLGRQFGMDADDVEEFAASVKLRLVENDYRIIRAFEGRSNFSTYIAAVVRRLLHDYRSANDRYRRAALDATEIGVAPDDARIERAQAAIRITEIVNSYIDRLPIEDRLLFRLRFEAEMNAAQIARSLQLDPKAMYRRLERHFRDLRKELERAGIASSDVSQLLGTETDLSFHLHDTGDETVSPEAHPPTDDAHDRKKQ